MRATSTELAVTRRGRCGPCVIFIDDSRWAAFHQLAPLLRRAGVRTVRVSVGDAGGSRAASRLIYDRCEVLRDHDDVAAFRAILADEHVIDIQYVEALGGLVAAARDLLDATVAAHLDMRLAIQDKLFAAELFAAAGVRTPAVVHVDDAGPEEIAERFGFPVVVKDRIGSAGTNVVIADDLETLTLAAGPPEASGRERYYEQFVDGEKLNYAAAVTAAGPQQELGYRVIRWLMPAGTASEVETISDTQLMDVGRRAVEVARCTGLMNMDVIRDREGRDWVIDFNARAFGGAMCFRWAGIDLSEGYLASLGRRSAPVGRRTASAGVRFPVFPTCLGGVLAGTSRRRVAAAFLREARPYWRWLGARYWFSEALAIADAARVGHLREDLDSGPPPSPPVHVGAASGPAARGERR